MRLLSLKLFGAAAVTAAGAEFPAHKLELDTEVAWQSDIFLAESGARFEQEFSKLRWDLALTLNVYSLEYEPFAPFDFFGFNETVHKQRRAAQATLRRQVAERLILIASGGIYDGFQDYRRAWLDNYYRQQYHHPRFPTRPGYQEADPKGWNASGGLRWEYLPDLGFAELRAAYGVDEVAPGYVDDPATGRALRGRSRLNTTSGTAAFENVLSSRIRSLLEVRVSDTSEREVRWSAQGAVNCAMGERWVFRPLGGYTIEAPEFEAFWYGAALEFQVTDWCALIAAAHCYEDTGEVLDPLAFSTAAPALRTRQFSLGLRFTWSQWVLRICGGPYETDYDPLPANSGAFTNLYRDRHWALAQASISLAF